MRKKNAPLKFKRCDERPQEFEPPLQKKGVPEAQG